jgi:hypothetical protein
MITIKKSSIEKQRRFWKKVAKENGWDRKPFYVQIWVDKDGIITDSVSTRDMDKDYICSSTRGTLIHKFTIK